MSCLKGKQHAKSKEYDPSNGPVEKRHCTDLLCCIIFSTFLMGLLGITIWGLKTGNPELIGRGYDADGNICGYSEGYENYPLLYLAQPFKDTLNKSLCVSECPATPEGGHFPNPIKCKRNSYYPTCVVADAISSYVIQTIIQSPLPGTIYGYDTTPWVGRYCMPKANFSIYSIFPSMVYQIQAQNPLEQWVSDIRTTWPVILGMCGLALLFTFALIMLLRYCSGFFTWFAIFGMIAMFIVLGSVLIKGGQEKTEEKDQFAFDLNYSKDEAKSTDSSARTYRGIGILSFVLAGVMVLLVICLWKRIRLAIAIMKASNEYISDTPSIYLVPTINLFILVGFYTYAAITAVYLISSGDPKQIEGTPIGKFEYDARLQRLLLYALIGLFWLNAFIIACTQFVITSSVCIWYFAYPKKNQKSVRTSYKRLIFNHMGSIAFGTIVLSIVQVFRILLAYIQRLVVDEKHKNKKAVTFCAKCCKCCLNCFDRFIKFCNRNAYIQIALSGQSFCRAAQEGFMLTMNNPLRFGVVNGISALYIFFGKLVTAAGSTLVGYLIIQYSSTYKGQVYSPIVPLFLIFLFSYGISAIFLSVYAYTADTILACFCINEKHAPNGMKEFIDKNSECSRK